MLKAQAHPASAVSSPAVVPNGGYRTRIATLDEFRASRDAWNDLVLAMAPPSVFLTWEWIYTWWELFGNPSRELLILFVQEGETLRGILPLFRDHRYKALGLEFVRFCAANDLYSDHLDIIASPEHVDACLASVYEFLFERETRWGAVQLPMVTLDSGIYGWLAAKTAGRDGISRVEVACSSVASYIPLEGTFESYFGTLDKKHRYNVRSRRKRLYEEEGIRYSVCDASTRCLDLVFELHRRRAVRKGIVSSFGNDTVRAFHEAFVDRVAPKGWVSFRFLEGPQGPIAAAYNLTMAGRVYSYQKGIDPVWERHGPGTVLLYELVQEAYAQGMQEYNFLQGAETYKNEWTGYRRNLYTLQLYNHSAAGWLAAYAHHTKRFLKRWTRLRPR